MKKRIYLDIDMDYFVSPIEKASVDNIRLYHASACELLPVEPVAAELHRKGLTWSRENVHCFTNHKKSYTYWWMKKLEGCTIIHIDAHSDLYRNSGKDLRKLPNSEIGCYNYLWYALRDRYADEIYWVLPETLEQLIDTGKAPLIVNKSLIEDCHTDSQGLHIGIRCIDAAGEEKTVRLHVCRVEQLPVFDTCCEKVTIATSPEFIPEKADELIFELFDCFGADRSAAENIYRQHKAIIPKSEEELEKAKKLLEEE